jgi:hypothetical protein
VVDQHTKTPKADVEDYSQRQAAFSAKVDIVRTLGDYGRRQSMGISPEQTL